MYETRDGNNILKMSTYISELHRGLFSTKVRFNLYNEKNTRDIPQKLKLFPLLIKLKTANNDYNKTHDRKTYSSGIKKDEGLKDIILKDYETFEEIIKKIDENEQIDEETIINQNITLSNKEIEQYLTDIDTTYTILDNWSTSVEEQKEIYNLLFEEPRETHF